LKSITVKLDEHTLRLMKDVAEARGISNQSELVRRAIKAYLAKESLLARERAISEYATDSEAGREVRNIAETGLGDLGEHIRYIEEDNE